MSGHSFLKLQLHLVYAGENTHMYCFWGRGLRGCNAADLFVTSCNGALLPVRYSDERTLATKA